MTPETQLSGAERVAAIMTSAEGIAQPKLAAHIATKTDLAFDEAIDALRVAQTDRLAQINPTFRPN